MEVLQEFGLEGASQEQIIEHFEMRQLLEQGDIAFQLISAIDDVVRLNRNRIHRASGVDLFAGAGVVEDDGSFSGTLNGKPIEGKFDGSSFLGVYHSDLCQTNLRVELGRTK